MVKKSALSFLVLISLLSVSGCTVLSPSPEMISRGKALKKLRWFGKPSLRDDMDKESLFRAVEKNFLFLSRLPEKREVYFGTEKYTVADLKESCRHLLFLIEKTGGRKELENRIKEDFDIYRSSGMDRKKRVHFTGYFEPVFLGSRERTETFQYPLYRKPDDLLEIELGRFSESLKGKKIIARLDGEGLSPYFTRKMIAVDKALVGRGYELVWLSSPLDVFFLHIQGSGIISLEDGSTMSVNYAGANGRKYSSVGRLLIEQGKILKENMSMQAIRNYLTENPEEMDAVLNHNESYVFFREVSEGPVGSTGVLLTAGRSIATDNSLFPKGGIAFIETEIPELDENGKIVSWKRVSRFVIDQDRGGAIKGAGRVDIFFGTGDEAGLIAGSMNRKGRLFYLIKKRS
ncbi:MAG: murein transglycosylase A [Nitrospinota bacterium]